jgi:transcriptional regulator with XRE-family HTH domain
MHTFGRNQSELLRDARIRKGLSQREMDLSLGGSVKTKGQLTSNCERGKCGIPPKHLKAICQALDIPAKDFVDAMIRDYAENLITEVEKYDFSKQII